MIRVGRFYIAGLEVLQLPTCCRICEAAGFYIPGLRGFRLPVISVTSRHQTTVRGIAAGL